MENTLGQLKHWKILAGPSLHNFMLFIVYSRYIPFFNSFFLYVEVLQKKIQINCCSASEDTERKETNYLQIRRFTYTSRTMSENRDLDRGQKDVRDEAHVGRFIGWMKDGAITSEQLGILVSQEMCGNAAVGNAVQVRVCVCVCVCQRSCSSH